MDRPPIYPFGSSGGFTAFGASPETRLVRLVTGGYRGELLVADPAQDIAARTPVDGTGVAMPALCLSPDGSRVAVAHNGPRTARIAACDVFHRPQGGPVRLGANRQRLTSGPWRAQVTDLAWHPTEERWAALARPMGEEGHGLLKLYLLDEESHRQALAVLPGGEQVAWAPDGRSIYVLSEGSGSRPGGLTTGALRRYSLDGAEIGSVRHTALECFVSNGHGAAWATRDATAIEFIGPDGSEATLAPPGGAAFVESLWVGPDAVVAAWAPEDGGRVGLVAIYAPGSAEPQIIGRYAPLSGQRPIIIGRDEGTGAVAMTWGIDPARHQGRGAQAGIYALLPEAPFARKLTQGEPMLGRREVTWAGKPVQVELSGWVPASAFAVGDLLSRDARSVSIEAVAGIQGGDLIVGDERIAIPDGPPIIGETQFLLRYRVVE